MIKFFRHIRKQLLTENKFSKYLIYAVGEIVLSINNWNEERTTIKQSIMPEGYERIIDEKAMADLIAYLRNPG